jgi:hypothetical protein
MAERNLYKKETIQENFIKHLCCSAENHPQGWRWWKRKARRDFRRKMKKEIDRLESF